METVNEITVCACIIFPGFVYISESKKMPET